MKRLLVFLIVTVMAVTMTACNDGAKSTTPTTVPSMVPSVEGQLYTELGVPLEPVYRSGGKERNPWDIELYNGRLYVGSGDYDRNCGPIYIWCYDFEKKAFEIDTVLEDEQVSRFCLIDDDLYVPGIDPKSSWAMGTYYYHDGDTWITKEALPHAAHNFDIVKFDGKLFAGLGAKEGQSPILVSSDKETWEPVPMYRDGVPVDTMGYTYIRVYDFFTLKDELYAYFTLSGSDDKPRSYDIYRYDGEKFVRHSDMPSKLSYARKNTYTHFHQRVEYKGYQYFSTGNFYRSADMITCEKLTPEGDPEVNDMRVIGDKLYILCSEPYTAEDGSTAFYNSLRVTKNGKDYAEVYRFSYPVRALCFTYANGTAFFGMGYGTRAELHEYFDENGMVLAINGVL